MNSNAFTAADMTTAAASGHRDGYQAGYADAVKAYETGAAQELVVSNNQPETIDNEVCPSHLGNKPAAAQEAVAYLDIGAGGYLDLGSNLPEVQLLALPKGRHALGIIGTYGIDGYAAAPVAAAPAVDVATLRALADRWANDRSYTGSPVDDIRALIEQPTVSTPASSADSAVLTNPYTGQPRDYRDVESDPAGTLIVEPGKPLEAVSTPAAPGIDLIDASPKGGSDGLPMIARSIAEWHEDDGPVTWWAWCGKQWAGEPAWIGSPTDSDWPGYHTHWTAHPSVPATNAMQATSAEVGG